MPTNSQGWARTRTHLQRGHGRLSLCQSLHQHFKAPWVQHFKTLCLLFNPGSSSAVHMAFSLLNSYMNQGLSTWKKTLVKIIQLPTKFPHPRLLPGSCLSTLPFSASIRETHEEMDQTEAPVFIFVLLQFFSLRLAEAVRHLSLYPSHLLCLWNCGTVLTVDYCPGKGGNDEKSLHKPQSTNPASLSDAAQSTTSR